MVDEQPERALAGDPHQDHADDLEDVVLHRTPRNGSEIERRK
ncbi:hypothetical protein O1L55_31320 [Streptomyces albulus]|nr:hypothetical protein [Streptomyces noursei]